MFIGWYVLQAVAAWKIFSKAGKPGWHAFVPILNIFDEYDLSWSSMAGVCFLIATFASNYASNVQEPSKMLSYVGFAAALAAGVLHIIQSIKLAKAFGKTTGYGIFLIILGPLARIILGVSDAQYVGPQD